MNVQICTSSGTTRYVVKYLTKIDENNYVAFYANQKEDSSTLKAEKVFVSNTKVTSSAINEQKKFDISRHKSKQKARSIACTEMIQLILGFPQVQSNVEYIRVPTLPLGERPGIERECPLDCFSQTCETDKDAFSVMVPTVMARAQMFCKRDEFRKHNQSQIFMLRDQMLSKVTLDRVFLFSIRPPELLFINKLEWYFRLFERSKVRAVTKDVPIETLLSLDLTNLALIDGLGFRLRLRPAGVPFLREIISESNSTTMPLAGYSKMRNIFNKIIMYHDHCGEANNTALLSKNAAREWQILRKTYLSDMGQECKLPIVVFSNVKPCNASKFLIHILLSMGRFPTERDLWLHPSISEAFEAAGLIDRSQLTCSVDNLLRQWIDDQLCYYAIGCKKMDEYITNAESILVSALLKNQIPINEMPPVMYTSLVQKTSDDIDKHFVECKEQLVDATLKALTQPFGSFTGIFPDRGHVLKANKSNPIHWNPNLPKTEKQTSRSYEEQLEVQKKTMFHIDTYCTPRTVTAKNLLIAGPPGVGKTHCMSHAILYSLCKGLTTMTTAMLADRAFMLGGRHLHKLFKLRVRDRGSPHRLAELAAIALQKKPELFEFIRRLDVLFIDKCGQISAELLSILDILTRKVRDSSLFMGGILLIGTIDQVQLQPINGLPFLLSPYILTTFLLVSLKEYVRCSKCKILQEINELARSFPSTEQEWKNLKRRLRYLLSRNCTFVPDWESSAIDDSVLRIFPKRDATARAIRTFLSHKKKTAHSNGQRYLTVRSEDLMVAMESHAKWKEASDTVTTYMNSKLKEPEVLDFFEGAVYQFTHNVPGRFSTTQLCVLLEVPTEAQLQGFNEIEVLVAPPGTKSINLRDRPSKLTPGWRIEKVGPAPENTLNLWKHGVKAKRKQYGLRHHIASTIHSAIGHTVLKIATELGPHQDLWEKAMVVVLVSRVSEARDLIFVGDKEENIKAIIRGLSNRTQYDDYMNHVVEILTKRSEGNQSIPLALTVHPFRQKDIPIPSDRSGIVYCLVSVYEPSSMYVGFTQDMNQRLRQHNSGIGSKASSDPSKRPWGLLAYVTGFQYNRSMMRQFELRWQNIIAHVKPATAVSGAMLAKTIIDEYYHEDDLQLIVATTPKS